MLYFNKKDIAKSGHVSEAMRSYCTASTQCRRQILMSIFSEVGGVDNPTFMHMCCDVCSDQCKCELCITSKVSLSKEDIEDFGEFSDLEVEKQCPLPIEKRKELKEKLMKVRADLVSEPSPFLVGADVLSGLTKTTINNIVNGCFKIKCKDDLNAFGITSIEFAAVVFDIVSEYCTEKS